MIINNLVTHPYESPTTRVLQVNMTVAILDTSSRNAEAKGFTQNWNDNFWGEEE